VIGTSSRFALDETPLVNASCTPERLADVKSV